MSKQLNLSFDLSASIQLEDKHADQLKKPSVHKQGGEEPHELVGVFGDVEEVRVRVDVQSNLLDVTQGGDTGLVSAQYFVLLPVAQ